MGTLDPRYPQINEDVVTHHNLFHVEATSKYIAKILIALVFTCIFYDIIFSLHLSRNVDPIWERFYFVNFLPPIISLYFLVRFAVSRTKVCNCGRSINFLSLPGDSGLLEAQLVVTIAVFTCVGIGISLIYLSNEHRFLACGLILMATSMPILYFIFSGRLKSLQILIDVATNPDLRAGDLDGLKVDDLDKCAEIARRFGHHSNHLLISAKANNYDR